MIERPAFSREIRKELSIALNSYMASPTPAAEDRLTAAVDRLCREASALRLTEHDLARGLAILYLELPGVDDGPRRSVYRSFSQACVKAIRLDAATRSPLPDGGRTPGESDPSSGES